MKRRPWAGDVVLVDQPELAKRVGAETGDTPIMLALDGIGGTSTMNLMSTLAERGVLVSYGGMSRQPMTVQPGNLIFKKQTLRGFWLFDWYRSAQQDSDNRDVRPSGAADCVRQDLNAGLRHI